ncbi:MAG TPA: glycosyltransferase [Chloroflexota bacterium]
MPDRIGASAWLEHTPFAMYLIDLMRPRLFVELGTHNGISYCAFCQAVQETHSDTRCYAVDTWEGDPQAGFYGPEILAELRTYHDPRYGGFSRLIQSTFDDALSQFGDGTIDLLHLDGYHTYNAVKGDFEHWLPKMSDEGVVLIHDTNVREGDFGCWRLWEELMARYPHFEFVHGHGLGVVAVGASPPEELRPLFEAAEVEHTTIREFFYQLGRRVGERHEQQVARQDLVNAVHANDAEIQSLTMHTRDYSIRLTDLETQLAEREEKLAALSAQTHELLSVSETHAAEAQRLAAEQRRLQSELRATQADRESASQQLVTIQSRLSFQLMQKAWNAQMRLFPHDTLLGRLWIAGARLARHATGRPPIMSSAAESIERALEAGGSADPYGDWARESERLRYNPERAARRIAAFGYTPLISIVTPVYNSPPAYLRKALDSVRAQYYQRWELCICDDASTDPALRTLLEEYARNDDRVKVHYAERNGGIARASNLALTHATGEFIGFLDHDDELTPDALYEVVAALNASEADLIYSDEDKLDQQGRRCDPFFKPAWSPDLLISCMYTSHFSVYRKSILDQIGGLRKGLDGSQDYDLALRFTEHTSRIVHIPRILYHWRQAPGSAATSVGAKTEAAEAAVRSLQAALERRGIDGHVTIEHAAGFYRVERAILAPGKVSIIIPTRDNLSLLRRCIKSIESLTTYPNYEIIVVDNGSQALATLEYLAATPHRVIRYDGPFNYSLLNNLAVKEADGEYVLLLNNDTEVLSPGWLHAMVEQAQRPEVGAVGAKLLYPDGRIQHAGVVLGIGGIAGHSHKFCSGAPGTGYFNFPNVIRDYSAVTAACMMMRRELYLEMGGLNEEALPVSFNDVDLCLRLRKRGYLIVYTPDAMLRHYESATRSMEVDQREVSYMASSWWDVLAQDPYYNPNLTLVSEDFALDLSKPEAVICTYTHLTPQEVAGPLTDGMSLGQEFWMNEDGLCGIALQFATYNRRPEGRVVLRLRESDNRSFDVAVVEVDASTLLDNQFHTFSFEPIDHSAQKSFRFSIQLTQASSRSQLAVWKSSITDTVMGPYFKGDQVGQGTLSFKLYASGKSARMPC